MLVLTRRPGETIVIGDDIKVTVLNVKGKQIGLGFDAPAEVVVHREEVRQKIKDSLEASARHEAKGSSD